MVHGDHNKNRSGGFFLIILGALIFITSPLYLADSYVLESAIIIWAHLAGKLWVLHEFYSTTIAEIDMNCFTIDKT